jgi:Zn-dependent metalloprotease
MCVCSNHGAPACFIVPPYILKELALRGQGEAREAALETLVRSAQLRGRREVISQLPTPRALNTGTKQRTVYDAKNGTDLPGTRVRSEGGKASKDIAVNEAYNGSGDVYDFYKRIYDRNSINDAGLRLDSTVHYDKNYDNAFWDGQQMVYGDGDGVIFQRFTKSLDVIGHELTHGVTQYEAGLVYQNQPGALNEHFSDVFGSLVKQWKRKQTADKADWIIGEGLFAKGINGVGIRSMSAPGTAYDDPKLGKDPQPAHMKDLYRGKQDNGGVHINSGVPNRAFYLSSVEIGGNAWEKAGRIWYVALRDRIRQRTNFKQAAEIIIAVAGELYGANSVEQNAVQGAWQTVGVI